MKRLIYLFSTMVLAAIVVSCAFFEEDKPVEPVDLEFWEVADNEMSSRIVSFLYDGEADRLVVEAGVEGVASTTPVSDILLTDYDYMGYTGQIHTMCVNGMYIAAVDKENMATLDEYLQLPNVQAAFSELTDGSIKLAWSHKNTYDEQGDGTYTLYALKGRDGLNPAMDDSGILRAEAKANMWGGYEVSIVMNGESAHLWANLTGANIGKPIAIVVNGEVYSAPSVQDRIEGGRLSISGDFTQEEAEELARAIMAK